MLSRRAADFTPFLNRLAVVGDSHRESQMAGQWYSRTGLFKVVEGGRARKDRARYADLAVKSKNAKHFLSIVNEIRDAA